MNLDDVETFARVVETGSLTGAARLLGVPKSTVSRRVARLEDRLGVALVTRTARSIHLTSEGRRLHARTASALRELAGAAEDLTASDEVPQGALRITAPVDFASSPGFARLLASFAIAHPRVTLELEVTNRVVDLLAEGFDVAFRPDAPRLGGAGLKGWRVATLHLGLYAAPAYLEAQGTPRTLDALGERRLLHHHIVGPRTFMLHGPGGTHEVRLRSGMVANDFGVLGAAARMGAGIAVLPTVIDAVDGALVRLFPDHQTHEGSLWVVWRETRQPIARVRAFLDHLRRKHESRTLAALLTSR